ncbi:MAG: HIT family protein [Clostridium sp.]|uniref:HIT family protein n=1 Tax=Clostridium sp. TaxID=1506 RepID=UPI0025C4BFFA|nr:HIT family protein [Clostridium sp.]MCF0149512.1 HIT family protein [Clostridium sp.]
MNKPCIFCNYNEKEKVAENHLAFAIYDNFPVNEGHVLIIPKRHFSSFLEATEEEVLAIYDLIHKVKGILDNKYNPTGYNIGINIGEDAGQTIMHLHVHIIPRYKGDIDNPRGGIRKFKKELVPYNG